MAAFTCTRLHQGRRMTSSVTPSTISEDNQSKPAQYHRPITNSRFKNVGQRLAIRKKLFQKRKIISDFALGFALFGIMLMIFENEMCMNNVYAKESIYTANIVKFFITMSTATLLALTIWYHSLDIKLFMIDNGMDDWKLAMSPHRLCKVCLELLVYAIHPMPGTSSFRWTTEQLGTSQDPVSVAVPVDVILSLPMFLRLYLLCRVMMLHSRLFTGTSSQSLGALNHIQFNFKFIFKSLMSLSPAYTLIVLTVVGCLIASWSLRACEMYHDDYHANFFNTIWLIAITFLSVGYGDIVPNSYCGRSICVMTGIFGAGCTALVVAIMAKKLELSRSEKYVHNFVIDIELDKRHKHAAADIVKAAWTMWKLRKKGMPESSLRPYQRKLLKAIHTIRQVKQQHGRLLDNSITLIEMMRAQNYMSTSMAGFSVQQATLDKKLGHIEDKLGNIAINIDSKLNTLINIYNKKV